LKLQRNPGNDEAPTKAKKLKRRRKSSDNDDKSNNFNNNKPKNVNNNNFQSTPYTVEKDDLKFTKNETIDFDGVQLYLLCGRIRELENGGKQQRGKATEEEPVQQQEEVCVLWNHVLEDVTLKQTASSISYKFVMAVDIEAADVRQEMMDGNAKFT
jgi:hypothetical protein